jgi:quinol monooxygenase YgiN
MTVVIVAVFRPVSGRAAELADALRAAIPAVHAERGCLLYAIHDAEDGTITMIEKWDSADDLQAHSTGSAVADLNAGVKDLISEPVTVTRMTPIPAGTENQGLL